MKDFIITSGLAFLIFIALFLFSSIITRTGVSGLSFDEVFAYTAYSYILSLLVRIYRKK